MYVLLARAIFTVRGYSPIETLFQNVLELRWRLYEATKYLRTLRI